MLNEKKHSYVLAGFKQCAKLDFIDAVLLCSACHTNRWMMNQVEINLILSWTLIAEKIEHA